MNIKITQAQTGPGGANTYIIKDDDSGKGFMVDPGGYVPEVTKHIKLRNPAGVYNSHTRSW